MKIEEKDGVLHLVYDQVKDIPADILQIGSAYEGDIPGRIGWNFPMDFIRTHFPRHALLKHKADYVIIYQKGDIQTKKHELQHAKYHMDAAYQATVRALWDSFSHTFQKKVTILLRNMKYPNDPHILLDEFQAYYFTERPSFFGKES